MQICGSEAMLMDVVIQTSATQLVWVVTKMKQGQLVTQLSPN